MNDNDNNAEIDKYGVAPWLAGITLFGVIMVCMFTLAAGFA